MIPQNNFKKLEKLLHKKTRWFSDKLLSRNKMSSENFNESNKGDILVVEDLISNIKYIEQILKKAGYQVESVRDGELALRSLEDKQPDLILMDITLPGMDGIEACTQLKSNPLTSEIPIIFLSAFDKSDKKVEAFEAGGVDYVTKPFESAEILARIKNHLKINKLQKELEQNSEVLKREITERKNAEKELITAIDKAEASESYLENIINNIGDPVFVKDNQSRFLVVNDAFCEMFGLQKSKIIGKTLAEDVALEEQEGFVKVDKQVLLDGKENVTEEALTVRDGETQTISTRKRQFINDNNEKFLVGVSHNITDRKKAEEAVRSSEERLRSITENASDYITLVGQDLKVEFINKTVPNVKKENIIGKSISDLTPQDFQKLAVEKYQSVFKTGKPANYQTEYLTAVGDTHYFDVRLSAIKSGFNKSPITLTKSTPL